MSQNMSPNKTPDYTDLDPCSNCGHAYGEHRPSHCEGWVKGDNDGCSCPVFVHDVSLIPGEVVFSDMVEQATSGGNGSRPLFRQSHFLAIAEVLKNEANCLYNYAASVFASNYEDVPNGYSYRETLTNLEGRLHEWQVTSNMLGHMLLDSNAAFQWDKFKLSIDAQKIQELYTETIREIRKAGAN